MVLFLGLNFKGRLFVFIENAYMNRVFLHFIFSQNKPSCHIQSLFNFTSLILTPLTKVLATMEIFQATADKMRMSSKRFATLFVVFFISFPVFLIVSSIYRNSSYYAIFEGLSKGREAGESAQNVTINRFPLEGAVHNTSEENLVSEHGTYNSEKHP